MAVDRGELRYSIRLTLGSTFKNLRRFRDELKANRDEFKSFRTQLRAAGADAKRSAVGFNASADALERLNAASGQRRALAQQTRDARRARRAFSLLVRELRAIRTQLSTVQAQAKRTGASLQRAGTQAEKGANRGRRGFKRLRKEMQRTEGRANALAGSFLRMGGIISGFIVAQGIISGIRALIGSSIQFNRTIERSELGIAAILTAVGEVRGAFGETVSQAEQLTLATAEARKQTQLLRRDALTTAATFEQLIDVFQIALAPGLTAGLDVDEVRRFSLRISQAALALGVAQNQLSEEVRAILAGTIRPQTTRIATALGITNEQIRQVRELGQLAEFLEDRFAAFGEAGKRALTTVDGLIGRVLDGFSQLAGEAGRSVGFFDNIKDSLQGLLDLFLDFDEFGFPSPDPQTLQVLQTFFAAINEGFETLREELGGITFEESLAGAQAFGEALVTGVEVIIGLVQGLGDGFKILGEVIRGVADALGFEEGEGSVREITRALTSMLVVIVSVRAAFGLILGVIAPIVGVVGGLVRAFRFLLPILGRIGGLLRALLPTMAGIRAVALALSIQFGLLPIILQRTIAAAGRLILVLRRVAIAVGLIVLGVQQVIRLFTGLELSLSETVEVIAITFSDLFTRIKLTGRLAFEFLVNRISLLFTGLFSFIAKGLSGLFGPALAEIAAQLKSVGALTEKQRIAIQNTVDTVQRFAEGQGAFNVFDTEGTEKEILNALDETQAKFDALVVASNKRKEAEARTTSELDRQKDSLEAAARGIVTIAEAAETFSEAISRVTANFSNVRTVISQTQDATNRLRDSLQGLDLRDAFAVDPDVSGLAGQVATASQKERITLAKELEGITRSQAELIAQRTRAEEASVEVNERLLALGQKEQALISAIDDAVIQQLQTRSRISELDTQRSVALAEQRSALERGNTSDVNAAQAKVTALTAQIKLQKEQETTLKSQIDAVEKSGEVDEATLKFIKERLEVLSTETSLVKDLEILKATILKLEQDSLEVQRRTAEQLAQRGLRDAQARSSQLQIQAALLRDINQIEAGGGASGAAIRLRQLQAQSQELRLQTALTREKQLKEAASLAASIQRLGAEGGVTTAQEAQLVALLQQVDAQAVLSAAEAERLAREQERARILSEGTAGEAVGVGVQDFIEQIGTLQEQLAALTTQLITTFSQGISNGLVNAFIQAFDVAEDETRGFTERFTDGLEQAAAQVLQQLATQLLQSLVNNLLSTILQAFTTGATVQLTTAETIALLETTTATGINTAKISTALTAATIEINAATTAAAIRAASSIAAAHTGGLIGGVQGFAGGGHVGHNLPRTTPPPGIHRGDTVNTFLTPGEFVQRVSAVRTYGVDVMRALNRGLIDPTALRGLMGVRQMNNFQTRATNGPGFAEGGVVSENLREVTATLEAQVGDGALGDNAPVVAIPVDNNTFETQLAQGKDAFRRFLRDNSHDFDGILRAGRTGG